MWCWVVHPCHVISRLSWIAAVKRPWLFPNVAQAVSWVTWGREREAQLHFLSSRGGSCLSKSILRGNQCRNSKLGPTSSRKCFFPMFFLRLGLLLLAHAKRESLWVPQDAQAATKESSPRRKLPLGLVPNYCSGWSGHFPWVPQLDVLCWDVGCGIASCSGLSACLAEFDSSTRPSAWLQPPQSLGQAQAV